MDETWYNPTDNKYYLAARDMLPSAVMGVIDAKTNQWLANMPTGSNAHSISVDPKTNHVLCRFRLAQSAPHWLPTAVSELSRDSNRAEASFGGSIV